MKKTTLTLMLLYLTLMQAIAQTNITYKTDQATIDKYAPLTFVRADAPPMVIISGDRELELYGRYEEQAYFWRMLKLTGHNKVFLYGIQGFDHGAMPNPAFHILKEYIKKPF
ncbi:MAG: hypothetical protein KBT29_03315 [Prevotellaceae bacterium]|nr:hypothetical protein [Candidatus Minthosoma caballi]